MFEYRVYETANPTNINVIPAVCAKDALVLYLYNHMNDFSLDSDVECITVIGKFHAELWEITQQSNTKVGYSTKLVLTIDNVKAYDEKLDYVYGNNNNKQEKKT